jgi:hypothetical protein
MGDCGVGVAPAMEDFAFKVNFIAVVRVRADDKSVARKVVPTVLGAPGPVEQPGQSEQCCGGPSRNGNRCRFLYRIGQALGGVG